MDPRRLGRVMLDTEFAFGERRLRPDLSILSQSKWNLADLDKGACSLHSGLTVEIVSPVGGCRNSRTQSCRLP
jgi:hypothetical protein